MASNHKLTGVIRGRTITKAETEEGKLVIVFDDGSAMTVKVGATPPSLATGGTVKSVRQAGTRLDLDMEDGSTLEITTAEATSSVMVRDKNHTLEYAD